MSGSQYVCLLQPLLVRLLLTDSNESGLVLGTATTAAAVTTTTSSSSSAVHHFHASAHTITAVPSFGLASNQCLEEGEIKEVV